MSWSTAIAYALVGERLALPDVPTVDTHALIGALNEADWSRARIAEHAHRTVAAQLPWPHPVPQELRSGLGAAQFHAAVAAARAELALTVLETRAPSTRRELNADERRLMAEVPPHHVG